jgi:iron(III) transport system permease protein
MVAGGRPSLAGVSVLNAAGHTAAYGVLAAALATLLALPVALLAVRHPGRARGNGSLLSGSPVILRAPGPVLAWPDAQPSCGTPTPAP